jgi:hypothetical protein
VYYHRFDTTMVSPAAHTLGGWAVLVPAAGGLVVGLMARYGSERIRGHGIPEAMEAILIGRSRMGAKVAVLKPLSSAVSIGTGGPFGAEGPIIMTGGALGSLFAQAFHLSSAERKTLLVAGAAAGMAAIFATPLAAVLLAVELLLVRVEAAKLHPGRGRRRGRPPRSGRRSWAPVRSSRSRPTEPWPGRSSRSASPSAWSRASDRDASPGWSTPARTASPGCRSTRCGGR